MHGEFWVVLVTRTIIRAVVGSGFVGVGSKRRGRHAPALDRPSFDRRSVRERDQVFLGEFAGGAHCPVEPELEARAPGVSDTARARSRLLALITVAAGKWTFLPGL